MRRIAAVVSTATLVLPLGLALVVAAPAASAATCTSGISGPSDPDYAPAERGGPQSGMTFNAEQWWLYDCIPQSAPLAGDPDGAAGMSVNRSWAAYGRGSPQVVVAYMEGGVNWRIGEAKELRRQSYLNVGELPLPEDAQGRTHGTYDLDGDGAVTVDDYKDDPRIHRPLLHQASAGGITAEDLIVAFGNGRDDDHNGYVDDISGWNFMRDTNDPQTDNSVYGHADGESAQLVGTADNGFRGAGLCPNCRLLSVKMGDEAIDRPDRVAEGIVYAVDAGAQVIDVTTAALGQTPSMRAAVEYAYRHGVVIAWASNDFESADHTEGMEFPHVWPGNSVVSNSSNRFGQSVPGVDQTATTFLSRSSLTSYGAHSLFSVPNGDGSTSAGIPTQAGVAALVKSAGLDAGTPLDANEVFQVVRSTVTPISTTPCATCFPAVPGAEWNEQYGYGRPNVFRAVQAVRQSRVPPTADITAPQWYDEVDPTTARAVRLTADVAAKRAQSYSWQLQYGLGVHPLDSAFTTVSGGHGTAPSTVAGSIDLSRIPASFWSGVYAAPTADRSSIERYDVTVRVLVTDNRGLVGEDRRVFQLRHDDTEVTALHKNLGTSLEGSPTLADLEGRGQLDVVVAGGDGTIHALRPDGSEAPGFPVRTALARGVDPAYPYNYLKSAAWTSGQVPLPHEGIDAPLAVGDLDHDGRLWIVATGQDGTVYAWDGHGRLKNGFPVQTDRKYARMSVPPPDTAYVRNPSTGNVGGSALADLEGTGHLDIVTGGWDGHVYAWRPDGTAVPGWPVSTDTPVASHLPPGTSTFARDYKVATTPTIADVDGDGHPDVVVALQDTAFGTNPVVSTPVFGFVIALSSKGNRHAGGALLPGWPVTVPAVAQGYGTAQDFITEGVQTPVAYDTPNGPQLVANAGLFSSVRIDLRNHQIAGFESPAVLPPDAGATTDLAPGALVHFATSASVGQLGGPPLLTAVQGSSNAVEVAGAIVSLPGIGMRVRSAVSGWYPQGGVTPAPQYTQPLQGLSFLSAPALADVSGDGRADIVIGTDSSALHAFDGVTGQPVPGWPRWTGSFLLFTPAVGDLTGDGQVEVVVGGREGWLHAYRTAGTASANNQAWHWHQNDRDTGRYGEDTRPPAATVASATRDGARDLLALTAPGDDWNSGRAVSYQVVRAATPVIQDSFGRATAVPVTVAPATAGTRQTVDVPHVPGLTCYGVRAVDSAGNIGPVRVLAADGGGAADELCPAAVAARGGAPVVRPRPPVGSLAATGGGPAAPLTGLVLLAAFLVLRRRTSPDAPGQPRPPLHSCAANREPGTRTPERLALR